MNELAGGLDSIFNGVKKGADRDVGFMLLVFPFGESAGRINYISNSDRESMLVAMKEFIAKHEGMVMPLSKVVQ